MAITFNQVKNIFDTLPVGYYLGRNIKHILDETCPASYFNPAADSIVVSYPMIAEAIKNAVESDKVDFEELIRGLLYHEISHVILTPKDLKTYGYNRMDADAINIVEDERIETLLANKYMNTNFKKNIVLINNYRGEGPKDTFQAFYHLVRFHKGEEKWLNRLANLIKRFRGINAATYNWEVRDYGQAILNFFHEFMREEENKQNNQEDQSNSSEQSSSNNKDQNNNQSSNNSENNEEQDNTSDNSKDNSKENESEENNNSDENNDSDKNDSEENNTSDKNNDTTMSAQPIENKDANQMPNGGSEEQNAMDGTLSDEEINNILDNIEDIINDTDFELTDTEFKEDISKVIDVYYDPALDERLQFIINKALKKRKMNGTAINSYSGQFNVRAVGQREDYRWWVAQNRLGHERRFSKVHFNLIIDNSGSFSSNDDNMNKFIKSLDRINDPNFTFDVITVNTRINEWTDHKKVFDSYDGNVLKFKQMDTVLRKHMKTDATTFNIVLFDGDAHSDESWSSRNSQREGFEAFNKQNTILITDDDNEKYIRGHINESMVKLKYIRGRYCETFIDEICNLLDVVF